MPIASLIIDLHLPAVTSLKAKRHAIKPLISRLQKEFKGTVAECDYQDSWQSAQLRLAMVSSDKRYLEQQMEHIKQFIPAHWPDLQIISEELEYIN